MPGRERTDPGVYPEPSSHAARTLVLAAIQRTHPEEAEFIRREFAICESERFTFGLLREIVEHMEQGTAARREVADALERMRPAVERGMGALVAEVDLERRAVASAERMESARDAEAVASRTTALEHVKGAWALIRSTAENRLVVGGVFSVITLVLTKLFEGLSAWWLTP